MPKRVVPEGEGQRIPVMTRVTKDMREKLEKAASDSGRSLGQEVEFRLGRDFNWEASKEDFDKINRQKKAELSAARIQAIRDAGFQIVRETDGNMTVNVSLDMLHAEADGVMRSGFVGSSDPQWKNSPAAYEDVIKRAVHEAVVTAMGTVLVHFVPKDYVPKEKRESQPAPTPKTSAKGGHDERYVSGSGTDTHHRSGTRSRASRLRTSAA